MRQALSWSSNVGMVKLEERLGDRWPEYVKRFGFGQSTYSGLPGETKEHCQRAISLTKQ